MTAYGEKTFASVAAGRNAVATFNARSASIPAGTVTADVVRGADGASAVRTADYAAAAR